MTLNSLLLYPRVTSAQHDSGQCTATCRRAALRHIPVLEGTCQFLLWLIPTQEKFPRGQRFLLGDRIKTIARVTVAIGRLVGGWMKAGRASPEAT